MGPLKVRVLSGSEIEDMTASRRRFSQEFKDELCQEVIATSKTIKEVAVAYGVGPETLRNWLIKYRDAHGGTEAELTVSERARLKELERENSELRAEAAFLKKATAYFAREQRQ
jgi:transposase